MKFKIALVVPRFDASLLGGIERHAFQYAKILSDIFDTTVLTTKALDYITWKNHPKLSSHETTLEQKIRILRFPVVKTRNKNEFDNLTKKILRLPTPDSILEERWLESQGPFSKDLVSYLQKNQDQYDLFFFFSYLYYPIVKGLQLESIRQKSILLPALHREFPTKLSLYRKLLRPDLNYCFNTPEEKDLFVESFGYDPPTSTVIGAYPEWEEEVLISKEEKYSFPGISNLLGETKIKLDPNVPYFLSIGRLEAGKGVWELVEWFSHWKKRYNRPHKLLLAGPIAERPPELPEGICLLGRVSSQEKRILMQNATALVQPSKNESLSFVVLEAFSLGIPVLVHAGSDVLIGHCVRSQAGLWFQDQETFSAVVNRFLDDSNLRNHFTKNAKTYIQKNYTKEIIQSKLLTWVGAKLNLRESALPKMN